ncbi:MAG: hypothetical protein L6R41_002943 [Letrouitia leprolyta]|nr:MAG: hypothetical protein L6R41_002943 [Letrouitia leprolyta]
MDVDVFICGTGPVGLILAYQLKRMGISIHLAEKIPESDQIYYGRAGAISPRTMELLDQLGLADPLLQQGFVCKSSATFKEGRRIVDGGWDFVRSINDTAFDFILHLRQTHTEKIFREALESVGQRIHEGSRLVDFSVTDSRYDHHPRYTVILENSNGSTTLVNARYIIGADGASSTVRKLAGIKFLGDSTPLEWVRLDAIVTTNMPDSRVGPVSVISSSHGNVLWAPMDHGRTRIGFQCTPRMRQRYDSNIGMAEIKVEAIQALKPFNLTIESVDWWTIYKVGHCLADHYFVSPATNPRSGASHDALAATVKTSGIFIAGDAAHTHSSGTAQGMNVGIQDAVNMAWKLAGVIKGWFDPKILTTYESERRPVAAKVIELDKSIASVMSGEVPKGYTGSHRDPNTIFPELLNENAQLTVGLDIPNEVDGILNRNLCSSGNVIPGQRAPDVSFRKPGTMDPIRLYKILQNDGKFWILTWDVTWVPAAASKHAAILERHLRCLADLDKRWGRFSNYATIISEQALSVSDALLDFELPGNAYFDDEKMSAFDRYGIDHRVGGVVVVRPDGVVGFVCPLDRSHELDRYFGAFAYPSKK